MNAAQEKDFKLALVRVLIKKVEGIDPAAQIPDQASLWYDVLVGLETFEVLEGIAARLKADRELRAAVKAFKPFATFKGGAAEDDAGLKQLVTSEHDDIVRSGIVAMEAPTHDIEFQDNGATQEISRWKWTLLIVLYAIEFGILYGVEATVWNLIRQLGGVSFTDPERIGTEIAAAIVVSIQIPEFQRLLRHILARAGNAPVFTGDVNLITEHAEMITTGLLGGLSIDAGVHAATALANGNVDTVKYWMFLGYFGAFLTAGFINAIGQVALGKKLVVGPEGEPFPDNAKAALVTFGKHYVDMDILLHERLVHFLNWFLYNFYGAGFGGGELALAGSLWLFVTLFKVSFFWSEKLRKRLAE